MTDRTILVLLIAGGFLLGSLLSRLIVRASWPVIGVACCLWLLLLAAIAFGGRGIRAEAVGWATGFAAFLTLPAVMIFSTVLKFVAKR